MGERRTCSSFKYFLGFPASEWWFITTDICTQCLTPSNSYWILWPKNSLPQLHRTLELVWSTKQTHSPHPKWRSLSGTAEVLVALTFAWTFLTCRGATGQQSLSSWKPVYRGQEPKKLVHPLVSIMFSYLMLLGLVVISRFFGIHRTPISTFFQ